MLCEKNDINSLTHETIQEWDKQKVHSTFIMLKLTNFLSNLLYAITQGFLLFKQHNWSLILSLLVSTLLGAVILKVF